MLIFIWLLIRLALLGAAVFLILYAVKAMRKNDTIGTIWQGFKDGLRGSGFIIRDNTFSIEHYKWITCDDDDVCEDCLERASWPAMDIADWMKAGLPGTKEACTECGEDCRCRLVLYKSKKITRH